jgi:hypothetical protein
VTISFERAWNPVRFAKTTDAQRDVFGAFTIQQYGASEVAALSHLNPPAKTQCRSRKIFVLLV